MKKTLLFISFILFSLVSSAQLVKSYTEDIVVTRDGVTFPKNTSTFIVEQQGDGKFKCTLKNFVLTIDGDEMPVGTIVIEDVEAVENDGFVSFEKKADIRIQDGDDPDVSFWAGPAIGKVPVNMKGRLNDEHVYATIDIRIRILLFTQVVHVEIGYPENVPDQPTAIHSAVNQLSAQPAYDLQGRPVQKDAKGIVIVDGKKVMR